eukprot:TRINITY_DN3038_c0_g1_i2.p2 TRINITY_DN3038_c0_g1~~TRINITY_DN3038_c0_g1_i2.p2  ORF type:complete len:166 (-),score=11.94 TRINITY_DN3038_c0_g1_i2:160-657(-)
MSNLSPIAQPLADKKLKKRVLKLSKKAAKEKNVRRGVKEVVKALRKEERGYVLGLRRPLFSILLSCPCKCRPALACATTPHSLTHTMQQCPCDNCLPILCTCIFLCCSVRATVYAYDAKGTHMIARTGMHASCGSTVLHWSPSGRGCRFPTGSIRTIHAHSNLYM